MRTTEIGTDYITIDEESINDKRLQKIPRVHLIKLAFERPTDSKVRKVLDLFPKTNRYVIDDNIKLYNNILKYTNKKYYVENSVYSSAITFFKKNNKVLVNFGNFSDVDKKYLLDISVFEDVLKNTEVIIIDQENYEKFKSVLEKWSGNVIINNGKRF